MREQITAREKLGQIFGSRPLLIEASKLDAAYGAPKPYAVQDGVAIVDICGVLANEPSLLEQIFFGATGYGQILDDVERAMNDASVQAVLLRINSPGGDSENAFETAAALTKLSQQKPIWAAADNSMFSAAYLLATSASRIYVPEFTGGAGSVGVYAEHVDWSEYNHKLGVKVTYIAEGEGKTDGNPNEPLSDTAKLSLETEVARLYDLFVQAVSSRRGMTADTVRQIGAALKFGPGAVSAGLGDRIGSVRDALADLSAFTKQRKSGGKRIMNEESVRSEAAEPTIDAEALRLEARRQGYSDAREIVELCALAGMPGKAASFLARQANPTDARQSLLEARAAEDATEIHSHVLPETGTSAKTPIEDSPVVKAVERLAGKGGK